MIATLTLNPSLDLTIFLKKLDFKDINRINRIQRDPGGKGINISRILKRLGGETVAFGFLGGHTGEKIKELLENEKVSSNFVKIKGENRSNIAIELEGKKGHIKINEDGPKIDSVELNSLIEKIFSSLSRGDFLIMSGCVPRGVEDEIYSRIINIARRRGIKTVLDTDGKALYSGLRAKPFLIKPNVYEAQRVLGRIRNKKVKILSESDLFNAAGDLLKIGIEIVIISWGPRGIIVGSKGKFWRAYPPVKLKYTEIRHSAEIRPSGRGSAGVGAGDAVVAGFVHALSKNEKIEDCIRLGIACGTASTFQKGTRLCEIGDVKRLLKKVSVKSENTLSG